MAKLIGLLFFLLYICTVHGGQLAELYPLEPEPMPEYQPFERDCPSYKDRSIDNIQRPWGESDRAFKTLPPGLVIQNSTIPKAGLGVFTFTFIPAHTWLGEYEGEVVDGSHVSAYAWQTNRNGEADYYVDGGDLTTSSWQRFVNCPMHRRHENIVVHECRGKVYYMSGRDIFPGEELFVYYGPKYLEYLGININDYYDDLPVAPHLASITIKID